MVRQGKGEKPEAGWLEAVVVAGAPKENPPGVPDPAPKEKPDIVEEPEVAS